VRQRGLHPSSKWNERRQRPKRRNQKLEHVSICVPAEGRSKGKKKPDRRVLLSVIVSDEGMIFVLTLVAVMLPRLVADCTGVPTAVLPGCAEGRALSHSVDDKIDDGRGVDSIGTGMAVVIVDLSPI
jgi:hypothetical protein